MSNAPSTAARTKKVRIHDIRCDGKHLAFVRHHSEREARAWFVRERIESSECGTDGLIAIGRDGAQVIGLQPEVDPNQQDLPL